MREPLLRAFHRLPLSLRSVVATAHGCHLRVWRYGPETELLCDEALARDAWSADEWKRWQETRLALVLHRAATRVPFYRDAWAERRRRGDRASPAYLENWPVLEKESLRVNPHAFVADDCEPRRMFHDTTSGTTGKSIQVFLSRGTVRAWYALYEARCRRWYGVGRHDRWAILGGQVVASTKLDKPPFWVWNGALRQLYMSSYHIAPRHVPAYLEALNRYEVRYILAYPSALYALAREVISAGLETPPLHVAISNAEPLLSYQRTTILHAFSCPVRETYGMSEITTAASECEHGTLHLWPDVGHLEVLANNEIAPHGTSGDFVTSGLLNLDMPLIRYRIGDRGMIQQSVAGCQCGRELPTLAGVEGRVDDVLYAKDGRQIGRMDPVFKSALPVREAQIIQENVDLIRVRYVPADDYTAAAGQTIVERIRDRLGPVQVNLEECESIPRTSNGKFRAVVCALSPEERKRLRS